ncbi:hypothetical protein [Methanococcoides sp. FTZ1]|uniref:hypothetical protein n=1 Tax=Methanococcoides sp. FTZ1 TaxID=3439061 RepID=UPI003F87615A
MMSEEFNNVSHYIDELLKWCDETGHTRFTHQDLPERFKTTNGGMLNRAANRGFLKRVTRDPNTRCILWEVRRKRR